MAGGYMTFQGIDAKGQYAGSAVEEALPVTLSRHDDRIEMPQGAEPVLVEASHPILGRAGGAMAVAARLQSGDGEIRRVADRQSRQRSAAGGRTASARAAA